MGGAAKPQVFRHREAGEDTPAFRHEADAGAREGFGRQAVDRPEPEAGFTSPAIAASVELFPAPLAPSSAKTSPRFTSKPMPRTASMGP